MARTHHRRKLLFPSLTGCIGRFIPFRTKWAELPTLGKDPGGLAHGETIGRQVASQAFLDTRRAKRMGHAAPAITAREEIARLGLSEGGIFTNP